MFLEHTWTLQIIDTLSHLSALVNDIDKYIVLAEQWADSLVLLSANRLSASMVSPHTLAASLIRIKEHVQNTYLRMTIQYNEKALTYYYANKVTVGFINNHKLFMKVRVPIIQVHDELSLVHMVAFPIAMHPKVDNKYNESGYLLLEEYRDYLLISSSGRYYRELSVAEVTYCSQGMHDSCSKLAVLADATVQLSCLSSIYLGHYTKAKDL